MLTTEVQICNSALSAVGAEPIASLTENSKKARQCNLNYPIIRDELLEDHYWNFAMKRVDLAQISGFVDSEFKFAYQLPNDVARVRKIINADPHNIFKVEGKLLLANLELVRIQYVSLETTVSLFPRKFVEALAFAIAAKIAYSITSSNTLSERLEKKAEKKLSIARSVDGQEGDLDNLNDTTYEDSRIGSGGFRDRGIDVTVP